MKNKINEKELEIWAKVYSKYKGSNFMSLIENGYDYFTKQTAKIQIELLKHNDFDIEFKDDLTLEEILNITYDFLYEIRPSYKDTFKQLISRGHVELFDKDDLYEQLSHRKAMKLGPHYIIKDYDQFDEQGYIYTNHYKYIDIPLEHSIDDVFAIVHEFIHLTNGSATEEDSSDRKILGESVSITYELLLYKYLITKGIHVEDAKNPIKVRLSELLKLSKRLSSGLKIYNQVKNDENLLDVKIDFNNKNEMDTISNRYRDLCSTLKYYIGIIIAFINYKNLKEENIDFDDLEEYNYSINHFDELESLSILFDHLPNINEILESLNVILEDLSNLESKIK